MDWKAHYRSELESPEGKAVVRSALERHFAGDRDLIATFQDGGIVSIPHTTVFESAEPIARVVGSLYRRNPRRVLALGVLHGGALPEPHAGRHREYSEALASETAESPRGWGSFESLRGAFYHAGASHTPYGVVPAAQAPRETTALRENGEVLANEFSLDLFLGLVAAFAEMQGTPPLDVFPLYVLLTREPGRSFDTAREVAGALADFKGQDTAIVATGDLVHYGHVYSTPKEMAGLPPDREGLERYFLPRIRDALDLGIGGRNYEEFYRLSLDVLKNDQRNLLPVLREMLGDGARYAVPWFRLTDYSRIWSVTSPCYVASALVRFDPSDPSAL